MLTAECGMYPNRRSGGIGRRSGLKIRRGQPHEGSIPSFGTQCKKTSPGFHAGAFSSEDLCAVGDWWGVGRGTHGVDPLTSYIQETFLIEESLSGREIPPHLLEDVDVTTAALMLRVWSFFT